MRTAIISDIHGNATAFEAVLADIDAHARVEAIYCLGDNVGYGPEPERVISMLMERQIPSVLGNHELAINEPQMLSWFNPMARRSLEKTAQFLSETAKAHIADFSSSMIIDGFRLVHGFPPDSPTTYLFEMAPDPIRDTLNNLAEWLVFIGHTHELLIIESNGETIKTDPLPQGTTRLNSDKKYLVNVGSVGQPRDGDHKAKYVIWDDSTRELTVRFVAYDINDTVQKIYKAGLPEQHAWRLL
ncbi:MAG: metallophosphoesterase family protein [Desulfobacterales bacterium]|nr:metallophosphoesterase family protein [Desulfobacterales bacterium]